MTSRARRRRARLGLLPAAVLLTAVLLAGARGGDESRSAEPVERGAAGQFAPGTMMRRIARRGFIKIGVEKDRPGLGFQRPGARVPTGFDIEVAEIVAGRLGIEPAGIRWVETVPRNRERFLENGTVDLVVARYSITRGRRKVVGQAGPYYVTGRRLLVREGDKDPITGRDALNGKTVCSVASSTSLRTLARRYGADPARSGTFSECVERLLGGRVDAVSADGAILLGYAAERPGELEVVGGESGEKRYGIGYPRTRPEMCAFLSDTIRESFASGAWKAAYTSTLGRSGVAAPQPPRVDRCPRRARTPSH